MNIYHFAVCDDRPEDARLVASLAARWARRTGAEVELEVFPSAEAFLFRYQEKKDFDVLLLDIEMTGMDGVELAKTVRRDNEAVQIVFITGNSYEERKQRFTQSAQDGSSSVQNAMSRILGDALDDLTDIVF